MDGNGPYDTEEQCREAFKEYCNYLLISPSLESKLRNNKDVWYSLDHELLVMWAYDPDEDIHYIWG